MPHVPGRRGTKGIASPAAENGVESAFIFLATFNAMTRTFSEGRNGNAA